ncbi:hypothetical protein TCAL_15100 [Tigriopus californicus]|uniref:Ketoreductase domain-containing protein n=1 Tax=Tigriopus californicus TaxID=6832 RepID=A0A553NTM4_TIGCA|nr:dehydrogenase/reductase SDR family protein 7-like isoform X1 [Tigriopus californicus]TRY68781.1 hypothetical protein TCAL_15100 [Tigriopus californicus]
MIRALSKITRSVAMTVTSIMLFLPQAFLRHLRWLQLTLFAQNLDGQVVLITGASQGIGRALAHELYGAGCRLILASRNVEALEELKQELLQSSDKSPIRIPCAVQLDLADHGSFKEKVEEIEGISGPIDILINNAGMSSRSSVIDMSIHTLKAVMDVNFIGTVELTREFLPHFLKRKKGHIVNITSIQSYLAVPHRCAYSASKHALLAFTDTLRAEVAQTGISVSSISPGYVNTNIAKNSLNGDGTNYGRFDKANLDGYSAEEMAALIKSSIQLRENEVLIAPPIHRFATFLRFVCPSLFALIMARRAITTDPKLTNASTKQD